MEDAMKTRVTTSVLIKKGHPRGLVFDKIKRLQDHPKFMPDVKSVKILEQSRDTGASEWDVDIDGCPLNWKERDTFDHDNFVFEFRTIEGDFDTFDGRWEVLDAPDGVRVVFTVEYLVGIPVIEDIIGPILKVKIEKNTQKMLDSLRDEVESTTLTATEAAPEVAASM